MKSLMLLWREAANELAAWCCTSTALDYKKLKRRTECEGDSFLTIALPRFGKDFERSLELGKVDDCLFLGFKRKDGLPLFLAGFLRQIFCPGTAVLRDDPNIDCIFAVRQLTLMFGKILLDCSNERTEDAMRKYVLCEQELEELDEAITPEMCEQFKRISALLFTDVLAEMDRKVYDDELVGKHGPGATADRLKGNRKYDQREWPLRLEGLFPYWENAQTSRVLSQEVAESEASNSAFDEAHDTEDFHVKFLEPEMERPVRVVPVPKTLVTPRIIAIEPTCMQFMQQAVKDPLVDLLERPFVKGCARVNLARLFLGFRDQDPNRDLARIGSINEHLLEDESFPDFGKLATLDMSEASDRVTNRHVELLLDRFPHLWKATQVTRSTKADVPGFGVIPLTKFASMGSALTFPIEAMVFLTTIFIGIENALNTQLDRKTVLKFRGRVRVYGDDLVVPVEHVRSVIDALDAFGHRVNTGKSFWNGKFRESCGKEYFDGHDVSIVRVRRVFPASRRDVPEVVSLVSLRNQLYFAGLWKTTRWLDKMIARVLPRFPIVATTSPALGRHSFLPYVGERECRNLHRPLVKAYVVVSRPPASKASGYGSLAKCLSPNRKTPFEDSKHLERSGRPHTPTLQMRWSPPY